MEGGNEGGSENLLVKIERADAEIKMLRELVSQKDERITHVAEEIGEMRSMIIRKDQDGSADVAL